MSADDGPDLRDEGRIGAEELAPALDQLLRHVRRLDVLNHPPVLAAIVQFLENPPHPGERPLARPDAFDRRDPAIEREDRLDLQRRPQPRLRAAEAPAAA